jgi:multidrug efflux pump
VVLFSLILTIGLIVDDAIVVSEYADRLMLEGTPVNQAFVIAARRMAWPVITSTIVKIVVFLPLLFWPGVVGQFMKYLPVTTIAILTNSLLFALFFQPALGPAFGRSGKIDAKHFADIKASEDGDLSQISGFTGAYLKYLGLVLQKPRTFVFGIIAMLFAVYIFFFIFGTGVEFFPKIEPDNARMIIKSPGNLSLAERDDIMRQVEERIINMNKEVSVFYAKAGNFSSDTSIPQDTIASIFIEFTDWKHRRKAKHILNDIKEQIKNISGVQVEIIENKPGPPPEKPIQINVHSHYASLLPVTADAIKAAMAQIGGFKQIEDSRPSQAIEWQVIVDREKAAQFGIDIGAIGNTIQLITNGLKISSYRPEDASDEVDIMLRFPHEYRNIKMLKDVNIVTFDGKIVPLTDITLKFTKIIAVHPAY